MTEVEMVIDPLKLTLGDIETLEKDFGITIGELNKMFDQGEFSLDKLNSATLQGMMYIVKRLAHEPCDVESIRAMQLGELMDAMNTETPKVTSAKKVKAKANPT